MACDKSNSNKNKFRWKLQINICKQPKIVEQFSEGPDSYGSSKKLPPKINSSGWQKKKLCISWGRSDVFTIIPNRNTIWAKRTSNVDIKFDLDRLSTILIAEFESIFDCRENQKGTPLMKLNMTLEFCPGRQLNILCIFHLCFLFTEFFLSMLVNQFIFIVKSRLFY